MNLKYPSSSFPVSAFLWMSGLCFAASNCFAQLSDIIGGQSFVYAEEKSLYSQFLMEERNVFISLPSDYETSDQSYPLVIVTDGDWHIHHLSGIVSFLSGNDLMPKSILVAIPHADRNSDLLPESIVSGDAGGNARIFLAFIEQELIPVLEHEYRIQPFKVLAGHSFGGLFTTWAMLEGTEGIFNAYIAADPSLWWNGRRLITAAQEKFIGDPEYGPFYYFDQSVIPQMGGVQMAEMLDALQGTGVCWKFVRMEDESHGSIVHKSYYNGLEFVFDDWPYREVTLSPEGGLFTEADHLVVSMSHPRSHEGVIRYTTDGSYPNEASAIYTEPVEISSNTVLRASLFLSNSRMSAPVVGNYQEAVLFPAIDPGKDLSEGLNYEFYSGQWNRLPDFQTILPTQTGYKVNVGLYEWRGLDRFALRFSVFFHAESTGIYGFSMHSDDGSRLILDGVGIINHDGVHEATSVKGWAWLEEGYHRIEVEFFERSGDESLALTYQRPGYTAFSSIPNRLLLR